MHKSIISKKIVQHSRDHTPDALTATKSSRFVFVFVSPWFKWVLVTRAAYQISCDGMAIENSIQVAVFECNHPTTTQHTKVNTIITIFFPAWW